MHMCGRVENLIQLQQFLNQAMQKFLFGSQK